MDIATNYAQLLTDYQSQLKTVSGQTRGPETTDLSENKQSFETVFSNALDKLDSSVSQSSQHIPDLITGELDNLHTMMIDMTEAQLTMQSAVQVRNKVVEAYNDVKNMQF